MSSRITYCKDIYYFQVFLLVPAKGLIAQIKLFRHLFSAVYTSAKPVLDLVEKF